MAFNEISRQNDPTPDGGNGIFDSQPADAGKSMLDEVDRTLRDDFVGGGMAAYGDVIGAGSKNIHNEAAVERDPKGELKALDFAQGEELMKSINERSKLGHVGLYALMQGQGDYNMKNLAGDVAEKKLMANV